MIKTIEIVHIPFQSQTKVDHCGSSAVMIALAFAKAYRINKIPLKIETSSKIRNFIIGKLHKGKSKFDIAFDKANRINARRCQFCNKGFNNKKLKALRTHEQMHCPKRS